MVTARRLLLLLLLLVVLQWLLLLLFQLGDVGVVERFVIGRHHVFVA
jgi:hypothetical protein